MLRHGAKLGMDSATLAGHLCRAVAECDINLLRRMIQVCVMQVKALGHAAWGVRCEAVHTS